MGIEINKKTNTHVFQTTPFLISESVITIAFTKYYTLQSTTMSVLIYTIIYAQQKNIKPTKTTKCFNKQF
jgi:hypothetical protein